MTQPTSVPPSAKAALVVGGLVAMIGLGLQISGFVFVALTKAMDPQDVTPLTIYQYWYWYGADPTWQTHLYSAVGAGVLALLLPLGVILLPGRKQALHGDARWAKRGEIQRAGLLGEDGIIVGKVGDKFLLFNGSEQGKNVMAAAPPGSGKTQGLMIPNCLNWRHSLVALDLKGECYDRTAGYRASVGHSVYRLNLLSRDYETHQYDPFAYVAKDKNFRVGDIEKIANYLCPNPAPPSDPFWAIGARDMFRAIAIYLLDTAQPCTLGTILDVVETPEELQTLAKRIAKQAQDGDLVLDAQTVRDMAKIAQRPDKTHGGIKDQLTGALAALKNPLVRYATSGNTFDLRRLRCDPMSIYLTVARPDLPALRPIVNLFFQQLVDLNSLVEYGKDPAHKHEVLMAMDEFAQLGRLDAIFEGVTFFRSFGLRLLVLLQSPSQNRTNYSVEGAKTFEQSFDCSVFYTPAARDIETAELVSKLLGNQTVKGKSESKRKSGFDTKHDTQSTSDQRRALMLPQEVLRMPMTKQIIFVSGVPPIYADKVRTWREPELEARKGEAPRPPRLNVDEALELAIDVSHAVELFDRPVEAADMSTLDALKLEDFSCDFSGIEVPQGDMSESDVNALRDAFFNTLEAA